MRNIDEVNVSAIGLYNTRSWGTYLNIGKTVKYAITRLNFVSYGTVPIDI